MFQPTARMRDLCFGWCWLHGFQLGIIITGNPREIVGYLPKAHVGDLTLSCCGGIGIIVRGNFRCLGGNLFRPSARMGDQFVGMYNGVIITGHFRTLS